MGQPASIQLNLGEGGTCTMMESNASNHAPRPCVYVHVNHKQILGAHVAAHSFRRFSENTEKFDIKFIELKDHVLFQNMEGKPFLRNGKTRIWRNNDLQSFTPLRFMPPELMGYAGRAVVVDPDVFAVADVWELLTRDMQGKAIMCRQRSRTNKDINGPMASSVMLLDCAKLSHWKVEDQFTELFERKRDYKEWIVLKQESRATIGLLEDCWNDLDVLNSATKMLHTTRRFTQPWKTGLPIDFVPADKFRRFPPISWLVSWRRRVFGDYGLMGRYSAHPDKNQEDFFFGLLKECLLNGSVTEDLVRHEMACDHVRHDALQVVANVPPLEETLARLPAHSVRTNMPLMASHRQRDMTA